MTPRVVVIGGSGHVGTYLIPRLWDRGYKIINVSRGSASPYIPHPAWDSIEQVKVDRKDLESQGKFGDFIADLKPDIVVDMITFELSSAKQLVSSLLKAGIEHYLFCSTIWVYGHTITSPALETDLTNPVGEYGTQKKAIEDYIMGLHRREGFPATSFRPGHIVGQGWAPVNPQGNLNTAVWETIAKGEELGLPNIGLEMLHHVHADDVALIVMCAIDHRSAAIGECFNNVSAQSTTMRGYAEAMYRYFGQEAKLTYTPLEEWAKEMEKAGKGDDVNTTRSHVEHSPCASIEKARHRLGYNPRYTSLEAIQESVRALIASGRVVVPEKKTKATP